MLLVIIKGSNAGRGFTLPVDGHITIGRDKGCDIRILDLLVSRRHCLVKGANNSYCVEDLDSTNKTRINGRVIEREEKLNVGDIIRIGDTHILFTDKTSISIHNVADYELLVKGQTRIIDISGA